jgi:NitT/TauT family transport system substrate-binding protein
MKRRLAILALAPILFLAGCRHESGRPPEPRARLRVAIRSGFLGDAPEVLAEESGHFREQGLEIEWVRLDRSRDALPSLIEGKLDVLAGLIQPAYFNAIAKGAQIRIVADKGHLDPDGCGHTALIARKNLLREGRLPRAGPSRKWRIDVGRSAVNEFILDQALRREGIDPARVQLESAPSMARPEALQKGILDVVVATGADVQRCQQAGSGVVWYKAESLAPNLQLRSVMYGPSLLEEDPEAGRRFMVAYLRGVRQYNEGRTARNVEVLERRLGIDRATLMASCWASIRGGGQIEVESILAFQSWARTRGLMERTLSAAEFWEPRFVELAAAHLGPATGHAEVQR